MKTLFTLFLIMSILSKSYSSEVLITPIKNDFVSGKIKKVEFYFLPYDLNTFVAVTPAMIQEMAEVVEVDANDALIEKLPDTLEKVRCELIDEQLDIRSGVVFLDRDGVELHSIYLNGKFFQGREKKELLEAKL